jgi:reductive dehalogenase
MKTLQEPRYKLRVSKDLKQFDERLTAFSRSVADPRFPSLFRMYENGLRKAKEGHQRGRTFEWMALSRASRTVDYALRRALYARDEVPVSDPIQIDDPAQMTQVVKKAARWFGGDLVGICEVNPLWIYSAWGEDGVEFIDFQRVGDRVELRDSFRYVIVMVHEMDYEMTLQTPAFSPATDMGYSKMAIASTSLANFIRFLGYRAIPVGNEMGLSVPMAVDAGLGEMGRMSLLMTKEYGPRVRISKVFTELPLLVDQPIDIGVEAFCEKCMRCAESCPSGAISDGEMRETPYDKSNNPGMRKWMTDGRKCLAFWEKNGTSCSVCIRVCPWNKPNTLFHRFIGHLATNYGFLTPFLVRADEWMGYGKQKLKDF